MIGIMKKPMRKQPIVVNQLCSVLKLTAVSSVLRIEKKDIRITDNLYFLLISTNAPKQPDPIRPPIINTAPKRDDSSYEQVRKKVILQLNS